MNSTSIAQIVALHNLQGHDPISYTSLQWWLAYRLEVITYVYWTLWVCVLLFLLALAIRRYLRARK